MSAPLDLKKSKNALDEIITWQTPASSTVMHILQLDVRETSSLTSKEYKSLLSDTIGHQYANQNQRVLQSINAGYRESRKKIADDIVSLQRSNKLLTTSLDVFGSVAKNPLSSAVVEIVSNGLDQIFNEMITGYEKRSLDLSRLAIGLELRSLKETNSLVFDQILSNPPAQAREILNQYTETFYESEDFSDLDPEKRAFVNANRTNVLSKIMASQFLINQMVNNAQDLSIDDLMSAVGELKETDRLFQDALTGMNEKMSALETGLGEIRDDITIISSKVDLNLSFSASNHQSIGKNRKEILNNQRKIHHLTSMMFGNLSPQQKIDALNNGVMDHLSQNQIEKRKKDIQAGIDHQNFVANTRYVFQGMQAFAAVGKKLGLSDSDVKFVSNVAKYGSAAFEIGLKLSAGLTTGNIFSALGVLSSLFGRIDPAAARHQRVMSTLNQLMDGQQKILKGINTILEDLRILAEGIVEMHRHLASEIEGNRVEILINRELIRDILEDPLVEARQFLLTRSEDPRYEFDGIRFTSYKGMSFHYRWHVDDFQKGVMELEGYLKRSNLNAVFRASSYVGNDPNSALKLEIELIGRLATLASDFLPFASKTKGFENPVLIIPYLLSPAKTAKALQIKYQVQMDINLPSVESHHYLIIKQLKDAIYIPHVLEITDILIQTHHYYQLLYSPLASKLQTRKKLLDEDRLSMRGRTYLHEMLRVIKTAIAQQVLLSGDILINYCYGELKRIIKLQPDNLTTMDQELLEMVYKNSILKRNLILFIVTQELEISSHNYWSYDVILNMGLKAIDNEEKMQAAKNKWLPSILPSGWKIVADRRLIKQEPPEYEYFWAISLPQDGGKSFNIRLPSGFEISTETLHYSPDLDDLMVYQERLFSEIGKYDMFLHIPKLGGARDYAKRLSLLPN